MKQQPALPAHDPLRLEFSAPIWFWRGPAPWYFVTVPEAECDALHAVAGAVTYGWGMIPVTVRLGKTVWTTSLFPKDGAYLVPVRADVRRREHVDEGDTVSLVLEVH